MDYKTILFRREGGIATIILNQPEKMNALSPECFDDLMSALSQLEASKEERVLIITGAGDKAFSAGGDLKTIPQRLQQPSAQRIEMMLRVGKLVLMLRGLPIPTIAQVNGYCVGAGFSLALACDIRLASENARFSMAFVRIGLHPDLGGSYFLPWLVGSARACEMIFTGDQIDAQQALSWGVVNRVVPHDKLADETRQWAEKLLSGPPIAIRLAKRSIYKAFYTDLETALENEAALQCICGKTEDAQEGVSAFLEKRTPHFKGR